MKLKAVRGRNQFGYSFVSDSKLVLDSDTFMIQYGHQVVYSILRASENVPTDTVVIDYRLFDELGCDENIELDIKPIDENIPMCGNITLALASLINLDNEKVAEAVSKRIEDLKPHLDGLIVREGQIIQIPELKIKFIITNIEPSADFDRTARISWINLMRINIIPVKSSQCYNVILLLDLGFIASKKDIFLIDSEEEDEYSRLRILNRIIKNLFDNLKLCSGISLFASIAYSNQFSIFHTFDKTTGEKIQFNYIDAFSLFNAHENWLLQQSDSNADALSNPGNALERAFDLANNIYNQNNLHTIIFLCSDGSYSSGPNPVKYAKEKSNSEIAVFCLALGKNADVDFLEAIAEAGGGAMVNISSRDDIAKLPEILNRWMTMR